MVIVGTSGEEGGPGAVTNAVHSLHSLIYSSRIKYIYMVCACVCVCVFVCVCVCVCVCTWSCN